MRRTGKVGGFAWENCGDAREPVVLQTLSVSPDPIALPGTVRVSAAITTHKTLATPLKAVLVIEKAVGLVWVRLPCINQLGSCRYSLCTLLNDVVPPGTPCPEPLQTYGIPCRCPFKAGSYSLPASNIDLPNLRLPSWITRGRYRLRATLSSGGNELACVKVAFSLKT
ncbi:ganglioside GM2 activator-like isoform 2-T2 [Podargus strigoides]